MKLSNNANIIAICFSIFTMLTQSVYALSAPCPDMSGPAPSTEMNMSMDHHGVHDYVDSYVHDMNHSNMDHASMDHSTMANHDMVDNCCGEDSCPMNACASAALLLGPDFRPSNVAISSQETLYLSHYASVNPNLLVRPPISH